MARFIPYQKLPKKKQKELDRQRRGSWNGVNPVTRKPEDSKVYHRNKAQSWKKETSDALCFLSEHVERRLDFFCAGSLTNTTQLSMACFLVTL